MIWSAGAHVTTLPETCLPFLDNSFQCKSHSEALPSIDIQIFGKHILYMKEYIY
jgi:hypothetical protein